MVALDALGAEDLQFLHHRLGHLPSVDEDQGRRMRLDDLLDAIDIVFENLLDRNRRESRCGQDDVEIETPRARDFRDGDSLRLGIALSRITGNEELGDR